MKPLVTAFTSSCGFLQSSCDVNKAVLILRHQCDVISPFSDEGSDQNSGGKFENRDDRGAWKPSLYPNHVIETFKLYIRSHIINYRTY